MIVAEAARQALEDIGVDPDRMELQWASAAEGPRFVELITNCVNSIKEKGPLGSASNEAGSDVKRRLEAAVKAASDRKVRTSFGTLAKKFHKEGDYSPEAIKEAVAAKVTPAFRKERIAQEIKMLLEKGPMTITKLAKAVGATKAELEKIVAPLIKKGVLKEEKKGLALA